LNLSKYPEQLPAFIGTIPAITGTIPVFSPISPVIPNQSLLRRVPLSVTPYGPGNSRHDRDNSHWSMTNQLDLVTILDSPCASIEWTSIAVGSVNRVPVPFVLWYFACPRFDHRYPIYLVHPRSQQTSLLVPVILQLRDLVTRLQTLWCNITEWAQSTYPSHGWTNPALIYLHTHQPSISEYPKCTVIASIFQSGGGIQIKVSS
jgi:hypothetical protein